MDFTDSDSDSYYEVRPQLYRRRIVFDLVVEAEPHVSTRPEDNGALFRRAVVNVPNSTDKRLMITSLFNGPTDINFRSLMTELSTGLPDEEDTDSGDDANANVNAKDNQNGNGNAAAFNQRATIPELPRRLETDSSTDTSSETERSHSAKAKCT